jgi:hypothetical protein
VTKLVEHAVPRDRHEPGAERAAGGVVAIGAAPQRDERVLDDLLGPGRPEHMRCECVDAASVAVVEARERRSVAARDPVDEPLVAWPIGLDAVTENPHRDDSIVRPRAARPEASANPVRQLG